MSRRLFGQPPLTRDVLGRFTPATFNTYCCVGCSGAPISGSRRARFLRWLLRSSTFKAQRRVKRTSLDGKTMLLKDRVSWSSLPRVALGSHCKVPTRLSRPSDTNRNATIVASMSGRARLGLLDRIFRRDLSLRVVDLEFEPVVRSGVVARCHNV